MKIKPGWLLAVVISFSSILFGESVYQNELHAVMKNPESSVNKRLRLLNDNTLGLSSVAFGQLMRTLDVYSAYKRSVDGQKDSSGLFAGIIKKYLVVLETFYSMYANQKGKHEHLFFASQKEFPFLYALVERVAKAQGVSVPYVLIANDPHFPTVLTIGTRTMSILMIGRWALEVLSEDELEAIIAHECAHIANDHPQKKGFFLIGFFIIVLFLFLFLLSWLACRFGYLSWNGRSIWRFALFLVLAAGSVHISDKVATLFAPWQSRQCEKEADMCAIEYMKESDSLIRALQKIKAVGSLFDSVREHNIKNATEFCKVHVDGTQEWHKHLDGLITLYRREVEALKAAAEAQHPSIKHRVAYLQEYQKSRAEREMVKVQQPH